MAVASSSKYTRPAILQDKMILSAHTPNITHYLTYIHIQTTSIYTYGLFSTVLVQQLQSRHVCSVVFTFTSQLGGGTKPDLSAAVQLPSSADETGSITQRLALVLAFKWLLNFTKDDRSTYDPISQVHCAFHQR